jgi:hypothetical protein
MGVVHGVVLVGPGGDAPEGLGIEQFTTPKGGLEEIAVALAAIQAAAAET